MTFIPFLKVHTYKTFSITSTIFIKTQTQAPDNKDEEIKIINQ